VRCGAETFSFLLSCVSKWGGEGQLLQFKGAMGAQGCTGTAEMTSTTACSSVALLDNWRRGWGGQ
jgi:hypothetical protein